MEVLIGRTKAPRTDGQQPQQCILLFLLRYDPNSHRMQSPPYYNVVLVNEAHRCRADAGVPPLSAQHTSQIGSSDGCHAQSCLPSQTDAGCLLLQITSYIQRKIQILWSFIDLSVFSSFSTFFIDRYSTRLSVLSVLTFRRLFLFFFSSRCGSKRLTIGIPHNLRVKKTPFPVFLRASWPFWSLLAVLFVFLTLSFLSLA